MEFQGSVEVLFTFLEMSPNFATASQKTRESQFYAGVTNSIRLVLNKAFEYTYIYHGFLFQPYQAITPLARSQSS